MKIIKLLVVFLFVKTVAIAQVKENQTNAKGERHGLWKGYYDDSKLLRYEGNFIDGKEQGLFTYYANSDKKIIMATRNFDGKGGAYTIFYDEKGKKVSEGNIINKKRQGVWKYYHKGLTSVMTTENYIDDKLEGSRKVYYNNGILGEDVAYKNGMKNGMAKKYNKEGKLVEESTFLDGKMHGPYKVYDEYGKLVIVGNFKDDKKKGIWEYFENGKLVRKMNADTINGYKKPSLQKKQ